MRGKKKKKELRQQKREHPSLNERLLLQQGEALFQEGRYAEAADSWKRALKQAPQAGVSRKLAEAYFRSGLLRFQEGDLRQAISDLSQAAHYREEVPLYHYHLALARHRQGNLPKALSSYQKALEQEKTNRRYLYHYGLALMDQGESEKALSFFLEKARREPKEACWKWGVVNLYLGLGRREELARLLESLDSSTSTSSGQAPPKGGCLRVLRGVLHLMNGEPTQALGQLGVALKEGEPEGVVRYALGVVYLKADALECALDHWERALRQGYLPVRGPLALLYRLVGDRSLRAGKGEEARVAWEKALQLDPGDEKVAERLAYLRWAEGSRLAAEGKSAEAAGAWGEAMRLRPEEARLAYNLALLAEGRKDDEEAVRMWEMAIRIWRKEVKETGDPAQKDRLVLAYQHLSRSDWKLDRWGKAVESLKAALQLRPADPSLLLEVGNLCLEGGEEGQALAHLKRAHELQPENPAILNGLAALYEAWGEEKVALRYWEQALQLDPDNHSARERLSQLYATWAGDRLQKRKYQEALELCEKGRQLFPRDPRILLDMGGIYLKMRQWEKAEETFGRAIGGTPQDPFLSVEVGHRYLHSPQKKAAEKYFKAAQQLSPDSAKVCLEIGKVYLCSEDLKQARRHFDRALELAPQDLQLPLEIGKQLLDEKQVQLALPYLKRAVQVKPDDPYRRFALGVAYGATGRLKQARAAWEEALRLAREEGNTRMVQTIEWSLRGESSGPAGLFSALGMEMDEEDEDEDDEDDFDFLDEEEEEDEEEEGPF